MKLHKDRYLLDDYNSKFYISVISAQEIIHLYKQNKIKTTWKSSEYVLPAIKATGFEFLFLGEEHLQSA